MDQSRLILFGTWKNKLTPSSAVRLATAIVEYTEGKDLPFQLSFCPPMTSLLEVARTVPSRISVTAQNLVWEDTVSFTGETDAQSLVEIGCRNVILGHSERRLYLCETDEIVARKATTALRFGLTPVICIGEFYDDYVGGRSEAVVEQQLRVVLPSLVVGSKPAPFVIAYEPAWAISTSREALKCDPEEANSRHVQIRSIIAATLGKEHAQRTSIVYGGSASPDTAYDFFSQSDIDGGLVGGASQKEQSFKALIDATAAAFGKKVFTTGG